MKSPVYKVRGIRVTPTCAGFKWTIVGRFGADTKKGGMGRAEQAQAQEESHLTTPRLRSRVRHRWRLWRYLWGH